MSSQKNVQKPQAAQNIDQLNVELMDTLDSLKHGDATPDDANAIANLAGKVVSIMRLKIRYARATKRRPSIPFLE